MIQRVLASKGLVAYVLACATGLTLYFRWPFPADDLMLHLIALRAPAIYLGFKYTYTLFLFTTPYIAYSLVLSGLYIFAYRPSRKLKPKELPPYPDAATRNDLFLVLGEIHDPRRPAPSAEPYWLAIPERGLFTGIAIFGAIGTGKTSGCMYPYAEQLIAYRADDPDKRIGGLVLEVKGDFCHKVKDILTAARTRERLRRGQPERRLPLQPAVQRPRRLRARVQHRIAAQQSLRQGQGTVLAAGLHEPRQVHHPAAQGRLRLRDPVRCLRMRHQSRTAGIKRIQEAERPCSEQRFVVVQDDQSSAHIPSSKLSDLCPTEPPEASQGSRVASH